MRVWDGSIGRYTKAMEEEKEAIRCAEYMYLRIKIEELMKQKFEDSYRAKIETIIGLLELYKNFHTIDKYYKEGKRLFENIAIWLIINKKHFISFDIQLKERVKIINQDFDYVIASLCKLIN